MNRLRKRMLVAAAIALAVPANSDSTFNNTGTLIAGSGSTVQITGGFSNFVGSTLTGGKYTVTGTLEFDNANIVTNSATITLMGTSSQILNDSNGSNALAGFATNSTKGKFTLSGNQTFHTAGKFTNSGMMTISKGSTFTVGFSGSYVQSAGTTTVDGTLAFSSAASFPGAP